MLGGAEWLLYPVEVDKVSEVSYERISRGRFASLAFVIVMHGVSLYCFSCVRCVSSFLGLLAQLLDCDFAKPSTPLIALLPAGASIELSAFIQISGPDGANGQVEWARFPVDEAYPEALDLLAQHLRLWFGDKALIRPDKVMQSDEHGLPLGRTVGRGGALVVLGQQAVLVDVRLDYRIGLDIDKVLPAIALYA